MIEKDRQDENPIGLCPCKLMLCSVFALLPYPHKAQYFKVLNSPELTFSVTIKLRPMPEKGKEIPTRTTS